MATAKKLPSGMWRCQASFEGERRSFTAYTQKDAELMALEWQTGKKKHKAKGLTIGIAAERFIAARESVFSPKTIKEYKTIINNFPEDISEMLVDEIIPETLQGWINDLAATKSPKTVRNYYGVFAAVVHAFDPQARLAPKLPQKVKNKIYIPTHNEVAHILSVFEKTDPEMYTATLLASAMGLRRGEVAALENNKKDFAIRKVDIHQAFVQGENNEIILKTTKTYSGNRVLTAPQYIADNLMDVPKTWQYVTIPKPYIISNRFDKTVLREFDTQFSFHDLRHYYASVLIAEGVPERYAMYLLGHSTPNMIRNVYGHIMADKEDEISAHINSVFTDRFS